MALPAKRVHQLATVAAPTGGINASAPLAQMPRTDAVSLVNWIPDKYGCRVRKGFKDWIGTPLSGAVEGFLSYFAAATTFPGGDYLTAPSTLPGKFFASTRDYVYDITSQGTATQVVTLSGNENAGWFTSTMLTNAAGSFLLATSEADGYFTYDGTSWVKRVAGAGAGEINGANPTLFSHVSVWKRRAWFCERNSTRVWYLPVDSFAGTVSAIDFGPLFEHGGHVAFTASWTIDAGEGIDDLLVVVGSNGDVLVYKGTDPSSASSFELVGAWYVGQIPVGRRCYTQYGGDLIIVCAEGVYPLSYVTRGGTSILQASDKDYSSKIRPLIGEDLAASFTQRGWDVLIHSRERLLLVNLPNVGGANNRQWAMSTSLNSWCQFQDIPCYSFGSVAGYAFAGAADGKVYLILNGYFDNVDYSTNVGAGIRGVVIPAFLNFDLPTNKQLHMVRVNMLSADTPGLLLGANVNYSLLTPASSPTLPQGYAARWDTATWDTARWAGQQFPYGQWATVGGVGYAFAASLVTVTLGDTLLTSIDYVYEPGGLM